MAFKTNRIRGFAQLGVIARAVDIMTVERPDLLIRKNALRARRPEAIVDNPFQLPVAARLHVCGRKERHGRRHAGYEWGARGLTFKSATTDEVTRKALPAKRNILGHRNNGIRCVIVGH